MEAKDRFWPDANNGTADVDGDTARDAMVGLRSICPIALPERIYGFRTHLYNIVIKYRYVYMQYVPHNSSNKSTILRAVDKLYATKTLYSSFIPQLFF